MLGKKLVPRISIRIDTLEKNTERNAMQTAIPIAQILANSPAHGRRG